MNHSSVKLPFLQKTCIFLIRELILLKLLTYSERLKSVISTKKITEKLRTNVFLCEEQISFLYLILILDLRNIFAKFESRAWNILIVYTGGLTCVCDCVRILIYVFLFVHFLFHDPFDYYILSSSSYILTVRINGLSSMNVQVNKIWNDEKELSVKNKLNIINTQGGIVFLSISLIEIMKLSEIVMESSVLILTTKMRKYVCKKIHRNWWRTNSTEF